MQTLYLITRILAGLASAGGLVLSILILLIRCMANFAKESAGVLRYVVELFTSGFTQGTRPPEPAGWSAFLPQWALLALFAAMLVAVILPGARLYFHIVAGLVGATTLILLILAFVSPRLEILCLPFLFVWGGYYALAMWRKTIPL